MTEPERTRRDRSFGPIVLLGLAGGALAAVAATRDWATGTGDAAGIKVDAAVTGSETAPVAAALALVALAAWGVVLVTRGRARRAVAVLGLLAALGVLAAVLSGFSSAQDDVAEAAMDNGATGDVFTSQLTAWYYVAGVAALVTVLAFVVAVLRAPRWPAMGSRYDAPAARIEEPVSDEDMWRALDQGHDPTS